MNKVELDYILSKILEEQPTASDINITVGRPFQAEVDGELVAVTPLPEVQQITPFQSESIALALIGKTSRFCQTLVEEGSCDLSYFLEGRCRFRVNIFSQRGTYSIVLRRLENRIPTIEDLDLPEVFKRISQEKNGLVLVTGSTGSGKSTSLAAMLEEVNKTLKSHVITLEDPVEYLYTPQKATFNQRELGKDFHAYADGLSSALRQAPKVILVGEMRDHDTVDVAMSAAETGHLVLSTLHSIDAGHTIGRIVGMFQKEEENQIRLRLAESLRWIVCQRLLPKKGGGRVAAFEIMTTGFRVKDAILNGETDDNNFYSIMEDGTVYGMTTFDNYIAGLYEKGLITEQTALSYASRRAVVGRMIDAIKSSKGEKTTDIDGLSLDDSYEESINYKKKRR